MKRPWIPIYIADYLKDTTHLGALESGAYLHLIMDYWQNAGLPTEDRLLARIAKMTDKEWKVSKVILQAFFHDGWKHKRIDKELAHTTDVSNKRSAIAAARQAAIREQEQRNIDSKTSAIAPAIADTLHTSQSIDRKKDSEAKASAPVGASDNGEVTEAFVYRFGEQLLGPGCGGQITKLRKMYKNDPLKVYEVLLQARQKGNARTWIAGLLKGSEFAEPTANEICPPDVYENVL